MLIWILAGLLFAIFAVLGYFKGAVRMVLALVGLFVALLLARPLAPLLQPLVPKVGLENPLWSIFLPPVVVFFLISIVFVVAGFLVHMKVNLYFRNRMDDYARLSWQRLNQRIGVCLGLVAGMVYTVVIGVVVYALGYLTVQISPGEGDTALLRTLNQARSDLRSSGLDRIAAALDPMPEVYYRAVDVLALLYHNHPLSTRLSAYPPFLTMAERPEFQELADDADFQKLWAGRESLSQLVQHPKVQSILGNRPLIAELLETDLKDLEHYLRTGVSEKYSDQPILGRWELHPYLTFIQEKKRKIGLTAAEVRLLRYHMEFIKGFKLYIAPDNSVKLKGPDITQLAGRLSDIAKALTAGTKPKVQVQVAQAPQVVQAPSPTARGPGMDPRLAQRYGQRYGLNPAQLQSGAPSAEQGETGVTPTAPQPPPSQTLPTMTQIAAQIAALPVTVLAQGSWKEQDGRFVISLRPEKEMPQFLGTRKSSQIEVSIREERLYLSENKQGIVLTRF